MNGIEFTLGTQSQDAVSAWRWYLLGSSAKKKLRQESCGICLCTHMPMQNRSGEHVLRGYDCALLPGLRTAAPLDCWDVLRQPLGHNMKRTLHSLAPDCPATCVWQGGATPGQLCASTGKSQAKRSHRSFNQLRAHQSHREPKKFVRNYRYREQKNRGKKMTL